MILLFNQCTYIVLIFVIIITKTKNIPFSDTAVRLIGSLHNGQKKNLFRFIFKSTYGCRTGNEEVRMEALWICKKNIIYTSI